MIYQVSAGGYLAVAAILGSVSGAAVQRCPSKGDVPQYWSKIEDRCSPCTKRSCDAFDPPPEACLCFCRDKWPDGDYGGGGGRSRCGSTTGLDPQSAEHSEFLLTNREQFIWLCVISVVVFILVIDRTCGSRIKRVICRSKSRQLGTSEDLAQFAMKEVHPASAPAADSAPAQGHRWAQATPDTCPTAGKQETLAKTAALEEEDDDEEEEEKEGRTIPFQAVHVSHKGEGAPGCNYSLLPQNNTLPEAP